MAKGREIKGRIRSVENTRKITRTMEMVAASKMKRAQDRVTAAKPYAGALRDVISSLYSPELAERFPLLRQPAQVRRVDLPRRGQRDVRRPVPRRVILPHLRRRQRTDAFGGTQDAHSQRVRAKVRPHRVLVRHERRHVVVHADLFEDHLLLRLEVLVPQAGEQQPR